MEEQNATVFQELNHFQSKISFLFRDLINERNQNKLNLEESKRNVEKLRGEVNCLKKHIATLNQTNEEFKKIILECFSLFRNLDLSGQCLNKSGAQVLDMLQNGFTEINKKMESLPSGELDLKIKMEYPNIQNEKKIEGMTLRLKFDEELIKKEIESISELNFSTQFFQDNEVNKTMTKNELITNKSNCDFISGNVFEWKFHESQLNRDKKVEEPLACENQNFTQHQGFFTPKKSSARPRSPVFKDLGNRKQDNTSDEENDSEASKQSSSKLVNEKYLLKKSDLIISPLKRPSPQIDSSPSQKRGSSTPKRFKIDSKLQSPKNSHSSQLKKSFFAEAEISPSGVRKFTQTLLNIDCFKKKNLQKVEEVENIQNERVRDKLKAAVDETKLVVDVEEDDVIYESPKNPEQMLEGLGGENKCKKMHFLNNCQFLTPFHASGGAGLDETRVSYSVVKKCKLTGEHVSEHVTENQAPAGDRSPEYDSVPFMYKRETLRKRAERMKLPGHTCWECQKYYVEAVGRDMNCQDFQEVLNRCSRHRNRNPSSADNTPPDYWKPYLSASNIISLGKNEPATL